MVSGKDANRGWATGRVGHHEEPFTATHGQRALTRFCSNLTLTVARLSRQLRQRSTQRVWPPGRPAEGHGSAEHDIATRVDEYAHGSSDQGERVWWYVPDVLMDGDTAPVVIYLHGFRAAIPDIYSEHIHHLTRQGIIVIFPRFNKGSLVGMFTDNDQEAMLARAIDSVSVAFDDLGAVVTRDRVYAFGHSLGGLFAACWPARSPVRLAGMVLAHPSISLEKIPKFFRDRIEITQVDFRRAVPLVDVPVVLLNGDADSIAPTRESHELYDMLSVAPKKLLFEACSDGHGSPTFFPGHLATVRDDSTALHWALERFGGGTAGDDTLHYRFYYAALDALIRDAPITFDMGHWSDGTPVAAIRKLAAFEPPHSGATSLPAPPAL
jgi:pimeloyl-ACP methyl ester carboxylesterase